MIERIEANVKMILKKILAIGGTIFSAMSILLSFVTWEEMGVKMTCYKILIFIAIGICVLVFAIIYVCFLKRKNTVWQKGNGEIVVRYADIMKIAFSNKNKNTRIIVIPVNTCFDTLVDDDIEMYDKPLVSIKTLHGKWINKMIEKGVSIEKIDRDISDSLAVRKINPIDELDEMEKRRGKVKRYNQGTIATVKGNEKVKFFLLALSDFDKNNNAQCSKDELIDCLRELIIYYNRYGQGIEMFLPLMGTGLSRTGLSLEEAFYITKATLKLYSDQIHGKINIVVYNKEKNKISIFEE